MIVTILKKRWRFYFRPIPPMNGLKQYGRCDGPHVKGREIIINRSLTGREKLDTIIHECLHAADWYKDDEWIEEIGTDLARILWRLNYRCLDEIPSDQWQSPD